jgi:hypothetical protein
MRCTSTGPNMHHHNQREYHEETVKFYVAIIGVFSQEYVVKLLTVSDNAGGHAVQGLCLKSLDCWDHVFELCQGHGCWSLVLIVGCVGSGLCDGLITGKEESCRVCVCLIMCVPRNFMRRSRLQLGCCTTEKKLKVSRTQSRHIHKRFWFSAELFLKIRVFSSTTPCWLIVCNKLPVCTTSYLTLL